MILHEVRQTLLVATQGVFELVNVLNKLLLVLFLENWEAKGVDAFDVVESLLVNFI